MARLVTLDVTGTCVRIIGSPGFQYAKIAREFDIEVDVQQLNVAFKKAFKSHNSAHPCFGCYEGLTSRDWWQMVLHDSFSGVGVTDKDLCNKIGRRVYDDFAGPGNWELFPEVVPTLDKIKAAGAVLGVISNFDERLSGILSGLGIATYFDFVLASYELKYAKPDPRIFQLALEKADMKAGDAVHVGDNYEFDYLGASQAGMKALLLLRDHEHRKALPEGTKTITSLLDTINYIWNP